LKRSVWIQRGKGNKDATWMLRIISEGNLDKEELCAFFIDWQTFEHENWNKLM